MRDVLERHPVAPFLSIHHPSRIFAPLVGIDHTSTWKQVTSHVLPSYMGLFSLILPYYLSVARSAFCTLSIRLPYYTVAVVLFLAPFSTPSKTQMHSK